MTHPERARSIELVCNAPWGGHANLALTEGVVDAKCRYVYTHGQCQSLTIALHRLTGWQMLLAASADHEYLHMGITDGTDFVDVLSRRPATPHHINNPGRGQRVSPEPLILTPLTEEDFHVLVSDTKVWHRLQAGDSMSFAKAICQRDGLDIVQRPPGAFTDVEVDAVWGVAEASHNGPASIAHVHRCTPTLSVPVLRDTLSRLAAAGVLAITDALYPTWVQYALTDHGRELARAL